MKLIYLILIFGLALMHPGASAQNQEKYYFNEGKVLFSQGEYQKAIYKFQAAILKAKNVNDIADFQNWINESEKCEDLTTKADSLFEQIEYEASKEKYKEILNLNPSAKKPKERIVNIDDKLYCFENSINTGIEKFKEGNYDDTKKFFNEAKKCKIKNDISVLDSLLQIADSWHIHKDSAESLRAKGLLKKSLDHFIIASNYNPDDNYIKTQINEIRRIPKSLLFDYSFQSLCPYGVSVGYFHNWGLLLSFRFDASKYDLQYSVILGLSTKIFKYGNYILYTAAGIGYGKYTDYWFEKGEKLHNAKYPGGLQFEPNVILKNNDFNVGLGWVLPVFNMEYKSVTVNVGFNINLKEKTK